MMLSLSQQIFSSKKLFRLPLLVLTGWMATWPALAAGPEKIATLERQLWPRAINTQAAFDQASGAEILSFVRVMATTELNTQADIQSFTGIDKVNTQSVQRWLNTTRRRLQQNYASACGQCAASADWQQLVAESSLHAQAIISANPARIDIHTERFDSHVNRFNNHLLSPA